MFVLMKQTYFIIMPSGYVRQIASVPKCCGSQTGTNVNVVLALICTCVPPAKELYRPCLTAYGPQDVLTQFCMHF